MANKGLCISNKKDGTYFYALPPFVPGVFEFQFMRGTDTERDRTMARLIHKYKEAVDAGRGEEKVTFPVSRVIPINETISPENRVHTYNQVSTLIEKYDPISVSTCFCRHEAQLIDENDSCGKPNEVCMQFGVGATEYGSPAHTDGVVLHPSVWLDDIQIEDAGRHVHPDLVTLCQAVGAEGY